MIGSDGFTLNLAKQYARRKSREKRLCCPNCGWMVWLEHASGPMPPGWEPDGAHYVCESCDFRTDTLLDLALVESWS